mgnify:CR=1 FL=1
MKDKIKSHIIGILMKGQIKRQTLQEIVQNNYRGARPRVFNWAVMELIAEKKVVTIDGTFDLTTEYKQEIQNECMIGIMYN